MRFLDLLLLSLAALWQQKLRTVLTTLGVAFGGLVLFVSLSLGLGVQDTIGREFRKQDELRRIGVSSATEARVEEVPAQELDIKGDVPPERRERLKEAVRLRWNPSVDRREKQPITIDTLVEIAQLEHVVSVRPYLYLRGRARLGEHEETISAHTIAPEEKGLHRRLLVGDLPETPDGQAVLISEYLAYRWGLVSDADLAGALGKRVQVEFRGVHEPRANFYMGFSAHPGRSGRDVSELAEKLRRALPEALAKLDLSPEERNLLEALIRPSEPNPKPRREVVLREEFTIAGVCRMPVIEEARRPWSGADYYTDLWLPPETAKRLYLQMPYAEGGVFNGVSVLVDEEKNVKKLLPQIEAMGYYCFALTQEIEREQFLYKLIFAGMSCIAGVALLVAGLGITNTMLMSVLERTREVGIMKAVGAAEWHIQLIFLIEGALIGLVGGVLGVLGSWGFSIPGDRWIRGQVTTELKVELEESLFQFPPWLIVAVIAFCALVTTLAAVYPARRASRVNPVTALRHE